MYSTDSPPRLRQNDLEQQNAHRHQLMEAARPVITELLGGDQARSNTDHIASIAIQVVEFVQSGRSLDTIEDADRREFIALLAPIAVGLNHRQIHGWLDGIEHDRQNLVRARRRKDDAAAQKELKSHLLDCPECGADCSKAPVIPRDGGGLLRCPKCKARLVSSYRFVNLHAPKNGAAPAQITKVYA
jgi:hypothetical protein